MDRDELKKKALSLPASPGVYIMMNAAGGVIYVGKAKRLKNRVSQYFHDSAAHSPKTAAMVLDVSDFDFIVVGSEFEALVLECSLIKRHMPRYNILLKDGKGYHFVRIPNGEYPRMETSPRVKNDSARYYGPFGGLGVTEGVIATVCEVLGLPYCERRFPRDIGKERPCLRYHLKKCDGLCAGKVGAKEHGETMSAAAALLEGKHAGILSDIQRAMEEAAERLEFERAAMLRDRYKALMRLREKQKVVGALPDTDIVGCYNGEAKYAFAVLHYSDGAISGRETRVIDGWVEESDEAVLGELLARYYAPRRNLPGTILLPMEIPYMEELSRMLSENVGRKVSIYAPVRGEKRRLVEMATENARGESERVTTVEQRNSKLLALLQKHAGLVAPPERIEAFDISNTSGSEIVGGMTVFVHGKPLKRDYRRFKIKTKDTQDDYQAMREVVERRVKKLIEGAPGFSERPDLMLIDGGSAHASAAEGVLRGLGESIPVFGMVKDDRHRTRALVGTDGGEIGLSGAALFSFIGRIQEETHRFAIEYHRKLRGKTGLASPLEKIPGVGEKRRLKLMGRFKTVAAIKRAGYEELRGVLPESAARAVYAHFHGEEEKTKG